MKFMKKKAYLVLADGTVFEGFSFGAECDAIGELVFNTSCVGYIETLTDECYYGQIILETFPLIGNYGIIEEDFVGKCCASGLVVREWCEVPSNFRCQYTLDEYLKKNGIPAIYGVDTRAVTRYIRENGAVNAAIVSEIPEDISKIKDFRIVNAVENTSSAEVKDYNIDNAKYNVTLVDFGAKHNIVKHLNDRGCNVQVVPFNTLAEDIISSDVNGIVLSDGAGDPCENATEIEEIKKLAGKLPVLAIGLGHQLLALSQGAKTEKLKYGHRGGSQPVRDIDGTRTYITGQNHSYVVSNNSVKCGKISFSNVNDGSCEGINYDELKALSVQFAPDVCAGPHDTSFVYDRFIKLMEEN